VYFIQIAFIDKQKLLICVQYINAVSTFIGEKCDLKLCSYLSTKMNIDSILCRKVLPKQLETIQKTQIEKSRCLMFYHLICCSIRKQCNFLWWDLCFQVQALYYSYLLLSATCDLTADYVQYTMYTAILLCIKGNTKLPKCAVRHYLLNKLLVLYYMT